METNNILLLLGAIALIYYFFFRKTEKFSDDQPKEIQDAFKIKYPHIKYKALDCLNTGKIYLPNDTCMTNEEARQIML